MYVFKHFFIRDDFLKSFGIIAEFNPLHNGHYYLINKAKELGATHITAVISGNFVERGDVAIVSKFARAEMAIKNGIDLVLELPTPYSMVSAMRFANGGMKILSNFADNIIFGSECGDITLINAIAKKLKTEEFNNLLLKNLSSGVTYAKARQEALRKIIKQKADILSNPNDALAVEYVMSGEKINKKLNFYAIKRKEADHNGDIITENFCSASFIRNNLELAKQYMPTKSYDILLREKNNGRVANIKNIDTAILSHIKRFKNKDFLNIPDVSEGLENRIIKAAINATSLDELYFEIKTKRYTLARIRRIILSAFLGLTEDFYYEPIPYIRVLAFNKKGEELLKKAKEEGIKTYTSLKNAEKTSNFAKKFVEFENFSTNIYNLCFDKKAPSMEDYKYKVYKEL